MSTLTTDAPNDSAVPVRGLPDPGERVPTLAWPSVALWVTAAAAFVVQAAGVLVWDWSPWVTVWIGAAVTFTMFTVLHESIHHAVSSSDRPNDLFGYLAMPFVMAYASYPMVKFIHVEHHRNTNEPRTVDPDAWTEDGPWWQLPFRWATIDAWYLIFYARRITKRPAGEVLLAVATFVVAVVAAIALVAAGYGMQLLILVIVPQRIGLIVLAWWFDYLPHNGLDVTQRENKYGATRIRVGGERWLTPLFLYQNYHLVHHLHPSVPFYRYVRAWRRNETAYLDRDAAISTVFGRSLTPSEYRTWRRLTNLVGTNTAEDSSQASLAAKRTHQLRVAAVRKLGGDAVAIEFAVPADLQEIFRYGHGQHVTVTARIDGTKVSRSYSIFAPVSAQRLEIAVKRTDDGVFSTYANHELEVGDVLDVAPPRGTFGTELDAAETRRYLSVAAGSGITPILSITETILETEPQSSVTLLVGNRTPDSVMLLDEIERIAQAYPQRLTVRHVYSRVTGDSRRIDGELAFTATDVASDELHAVFVCGPQAMVEDVRDHAHSRGLQTDRARTEIFHTDSATPQQDHGDLPEIDSEVTITLNGATTSFPLKSTAEVVLDAALQRDLDVPYSCAGGACGTCRVKLTTGNVVMDQQSALTDTEVDAGYILACQAHPTTDKITLDYDAG